MQWYTKNYGATTLCEPLKKNAPFQCIQQKPMSELERLSLAYANTQLVYGVMSGIFVLMLYKCKKAKRPTDSDAEEIQELKARFEALESMVMNLRNVAPTTENTVEP